MISSTYFSVVIDDILKFTGKTRGIAYYTIHHQYISDHRMYVIFGVKDRSIEKSLNILSNFSGHVVNFAQTSDLLRKSCWTASFYYISLFLIFEAIYGILFCELTKGFLQLRIENILRILILLASFPWFIMISWNRLASINRTIFGVS